MLQAGDIITLKKHRYPKEQSFRVVKVVTKGDFTFAYVTKLRGEKVFIATWRGEYPPQVVDIAKTKKTLEQILEGK
jgi:hypothetical protein